MKTYNDRLLKLLNRDDLPRFLNINYPYKKMVEVGTYYGEFAEHILKIWHGELFCIDPWEDQPDSEYRDGCANGGRAGGRNPMNPIFTQALKRLEAVGGARVEVRRQFSVDAMPGFEPESLSCVYVDGNHSYETALQDFNGWWDRLAPAGLIGTHDCYIRKDEVQNCGVWDAVWEFSENIGQRPFLTNCGSAWWIK